jgi:tRNA pseudouridine55 synthase
MSDAAARRTMDGLLIVDKPEGMTSADVVRIVKQQLRHKTGHLGTLDPFASGVLPLCVGEGTKIAQFLNAADKEYSGVIRLGSRTDTGDPTGTVLDVAPVARLDAHRLAELARHLCGESWQIPPMYSAVKQAGTPLYKLARQGIAVERQARRVRIDRLCLEPEGEAGIAFRVRCSKGTYMRVLAEHVAAALGTLGHLQSLRRTRFGRFDLQQAVSLAGVRRDAVRLIGMRDSLADLREIEIAAALARRARQGYQPILACIAPGARGELAKLVGPDGDLAAVIVMHEMGRWRFARVFAEPPLA